MGSNGNGHHKNQREGQGSGHLPPSGSANAGPLGGQDQFLQASEVMELVFGITKTSADVYEMIADLAGYASESSNGHALAGSPERQRQVASLLRGFSKGNE